MKTKNQVENMLSFIRFQNDNNFMNQTYRKGVLDALRFVNGTDGYLEYYKEHLTKVCKELEEKDE